MSGLHLPDTALDYAKDVRALVDAIGVDHVCTARIPSSPSMAVAPAAGVVDPATHARVNRMPASGNAPVWHDRIKIKPLKGQTNYRRSSNCFWSMPICLRIL